MTKRSRKPRRRRQKPQYPIATIAQYGPDDKTVTKLAVGIIEAEDAEPIMERWYGSDVMTNPEIQAQIAGFIEAHGVQSVVRTDGVIGCPHEEGIDFPKGRECPYCPFWRGKQGIQVRGERQEADSQQELKLLTRRHMRLVWEEAQLGATFAGEEARLVEAMREHSEYHHLWGRLDELSDEELEQDGVNPMLHITVHSIVENQLADGNPPQVDVVLKALTLQGLSRHEAIHRIGSVLSEEIFHILKDGRPFDERLYVQKLWELVR